MFQDATVRDGREAGNNLCHLRREDTWVVYENLTGQALEPAKVVVICQRTGRVLYDGSASDEG